MTIQSEWEIGPAALLDRSAAVFGGSSTASFNSDKSYYPFESKLNFIGLVCERSKAKRESETAFMDTHWPYEIQFTGLVLGLKSEWLGMN